MSELRTYSEVHRPIGFEGIIDVNGQVRQIRNVLTKRLKQHFLFVGPAGSGKTTTAWAVAREFIEINMSKSARMMMTNIDDAILYINASDEKGIDTVRNKIKPVVTIAGINVIILDEFDAILKTSQHALRGIMEDAEKMKSPKLFIFTGNYVDRIINPIISRCGGQAYLFPR